MMLGLPLIIPRDDHIIGYPSTHLPSSFLDDTNEPTTTSNPPQRRPQTHQSNNNHNPRSSLALLAADEKLIEQRKANIRRFGAGWLRPPGIAKTYQATMDEAAEREEQEALARREMALMELANAQEAEEEERRRAAGEGEGGEVEEGERDLDDEIPEAEDEGDEEGEGDGGEGASFNEESFIEGSEVMAPEEINEMLEMEEAEMSGVLQEERDLGFGERDLDDSVPEAGSYQHTDTEVEDESSEEEMEAVPGNVHMMVPPQGLRRVTPQRIRHQDTPPLRSRGRGLRDQAAPLESPELAGASSSFLESSPFASRGRNVGLHARPRQRRGH